MRLNISAVAIRHPIPPTILFILLTLAGLVAFANMDITANPDIDFPIVTVAVARPGAAPSELEAQVTRKIEDAVAGLGNIDHIRSTITESSSVTSVEFAIGTNTDRAVNDVRDAVAKARRNLPADIIDPVVQRLDVAGLPLFYFSVVAPSMTTEELSWFVDDTVSRAMLAVKGVAQVNRVGGVDREIRVELDPARLIALGITADAINAQLVALNIDIPGGRGTVGSAEQSIRTLGGARTADELRNTEIPLSNGRKVRLSDIGRVIDGPAEQRQAARYDGQSVVSFNIQRSPNTSDVTIAEGVHKNLEQLRRDHPEIEFKEIISTVTFTVDAYNASIEALLIGAVLAVAVVYWFLRDTRATVISALAMPLSAIPTFAAMQMLGFTLNGISLLALSLVVGILVDDAIVEIENIVRHIRSGKRPYEASLEAADEIGLAVIATTMTIVVVFLPVSFMGGIPGQFFRQFGITVAVAVVFSLLVARLITPLMAAFFLKPHDAVPPSAWMNRYIALLKWSLAHRGRTVLMAVGIFVASLMLIPLIPVGFFPEADINQSMLQVELPPGSTLADTDRATSQLSELLRKRPEVQHVLASMGSLGSYGPGSGAGGVRKATLYINLVGKSDRKLSQKQFETSMRPALLTVPGIRFNFQSTGFDAKDVTVTLISDDGPVLSRAAQELLTQIRTVPGMLNVSSSANLLGPEVRIKPQFERAAAEGVSVLQIGRVAMLATLGDIDQNLAKFNLGDRQIPIRVQLNPDSRKDLTTIENLRVMTSRGVAVPLKSVADVSIDAGAVQIDRFDRSRKIEIGGDLAAGMEFGPIMAAINDLPAMKNLPPEVHLAKAGNAEQLEVLMRGFGIALMASIFLIFSVLVLLFGNFFQPPTIMMALPLSVGGAMIALLVTQTTLSMPAMIGLLMLMGIVTKNSILLVEFAIVAMRDRGMSRWDALVEAGQTRARPILMTTVAMIAGMAPTAVGFGAQSDFRAPMAVAVIGGLVTSTLFSLVLIPVVFTYMDDMQRWTVVRLRRLLTIDPVRPAKPSAAPPHSPRRNSHSRN